MWRNQPYQAPPIGGYYAPPPPPQPVPPVDPFRAYYADRLRELTFNSRPLIQELSVVAMQQRDAQHWPNMHAVVEEIEAAILRVRVGNGLTRPVLRRSRCDLKAELGKEMVLMFDLNSHRHRRSCQSFTSSTRSRKTSALRTPPTSYPPSFPDCMRGHTVRSTGLPSPRWRK
jgi:hypothetical protein